MRAVRVERQSAEHARRILANEGLLDKSRRIKTVRDFVELPVFSGKISINDIDFTLIEQQDPVFRTPSSSFEEVRKTLGARLRIDTAALQGGWEKIGDILIIELPETLLEKKEDIGAELLKLFPKSRTVVNRLAIEGTHREPRIEVIAGNGTETTHKENKCLFKLDVARVMFSAGNVSERQRMATISSNTETVLDMFSGIGQLSIPLAKHGRPRHVYAIEKNPVAFEFLSENIRLNRLSNMEPILGDCRDVKTPKCDRILMGYFFEPEIYLSRAMASINPGGTIHFHNIAAKKDIQKRKGEIKNKIKNLGMDAELSHVIVKSYAPSRWHIVFDIVVQPM
jgi:tRNA wybutosine-synthesizing protein 2